MTLEAKIDGGGAKKEIGGVEVGTRGVEAGTRGVEVGTEEEDLGVINVTGLDQETNIEGPDLETGNLDLDHTEGKKEAGIEIMIMRRNLGKRAQT